MKTKKHRTGGTRSRSRSRDRMIREKNYTIRPLPISGRSRGTRSRMSRKGYSTVEDWKGETDMSDIIEIFNESRQLHFDYNYITKLFLLGYYSSQTGNLRAKSEQIIQRLNSSLSDRVIDLSNGTGVPPDTMFTKVVEKAVQFYNAYLSVPTAHRLGYNSVPPMYSGITPNHAMIASLEHYSSLANESKRVIELPSFISTSLNINVAARFTSELNPHIIVVNVPPKKLRTFKYCALLNDVVRFPIPSNFDGELEVLLGMGMRFKINKTKMDSLEYERSVGMTMSPDGHATNVFEKKTMRDIVIYELEYVGANFILPDVLQSKLNKLVTQLDLVL